MGVFPAPRPLAGGDRAPRGPAAGARGDRRAPPCRDATDLDHRARRCRQDPSGAGGRVRPRPEPRTVLVTLAAVEHPEGLLPAIGVWTAALRRVARRRAGGAPREPDRARPRRLRADRRRRSRDRATGPPGGRPGGDPRPRSVRSGCRPSTWCGSVRSRCPPPAWRTPTSWGIIPLVVLYCQRALVRGPPLRAHPRETPPRCRSCAAASTVSRWRSSSPVVAPGDALVEELVRRPDGGLDLLRASPVRGLLRHDGLWMIQSDVRPAATARRHLLGRLSMLAGTFGTRRGARRCSRPAPSTATCSTTCVESSTCTSRTRSTARPAGGSWCRARCACMQGRIEADGTAGVHRARRRPTGSWRWPGGPPTLPTTTAATLTAWVDAEHHLLEGNVPRDAVERSLAEQAAWPVAGLAVVLGTSRVPRRRGRAGPARLGANRPHLETKATADTSTWSRSGLQQIKEEPAVVENVDPNGRCCSPPRGLPDGGAACPVGPPAAPALHRRSSRSRAERGAGPRLAVDGNEAWQGRFEVWAGMIADQLGDLDRAVELAGWAGVERVRLGDDRTLVHVAMLLLPLVGTDRRPGDPSVDEALAAAAGSALHLEIALLPVRTGSRPETSRAPPARSGRRWNRPLPSDPATVFNLMGAAHVFERLGEPARAARIRRRRLLPTGVAREVHAAVE